MTTEERLDRVETSLRRWRIACSLLAIAVIGGVLLGAQQHTTTFDMIRCKGIIVEGDDGKPVGGFFSDGKIGCSKVQAFDGEGNTRIVLTPGPQGPHIKLISGQGIDRITIGARDDGSSIIGVADPLSGKPVATMGFHVEDKNTGASFAIFDRKQRPRGLMATTEESGPTLMLFDEKQKPLWSEPSDK